MFFFLFYSSYRKINSNWFFKTYPLKPDICLIGISYYNLVLRATVKTWHNQTQFKQTNYIRAHRGWAEQGSLNITYDFHQNQALDKSKIPKLGPCSNWDPATDVPKASWCWEWGCPERCFYSTPKLDSSETHWTKLCWWRAVAEKDVIAKPRHEISKDL